MLQLMVFPLRRALAASCNWDRSMTLGSRPLVEVAAGRNRLCTSLFAVSDRLKHGISRRTA